jgi:hypothetical protein
MTEIATPALAFVARTFDEPDDRRSFPHGHADVVDVGERHLLRITFEPGFRWSVDMAPVAGTARCQVRHVFWVESGRMGLDPSDGAAVEIGPGEIVSLAPDHDAWTIGDEPVVFYDIDPKSPSS